MVTLIALLRFLLNVYGNMKQVGDRSLTLDAKPYCSKQPYCMVGTSTISLSRMQMKR